MTPTRAANQKLVIGCEESPVHQAGTKAEYSSPEESDQVRQIHPVRLLLSHAPTARSFIAPWRTDASLHLVTILRGTVLRNGRI